MRKSNKKICVATTVHYPLDTRIYFKQICTLSKNYIVDYYAQYCTQNVSEPSGRYVALPESKSKLGRLWTNYKLFNLLIKSDYSIYIFHDPELWLLGLFLKWGKKTVIIDIHEHFSKQIQNKEWIPSFFKKTLSFIVDKVEKQLPKIFDHLILAEDSYLKMFNNASNITVIHNFPFKQQKNKSDYNFNVFKMVYVGNIIKVRGIIECLKLLKHGKENKLNLKLVLIGPFADDSTKTEYEEYIKNNDLESDIVYYGQIPNKDVYDIITECELGLALLHPIKNYVSSYPTKIFEYMSIGLPTLASSFELWDAVLIVNECGYTVDPFNVVKAFQIVKTYYNDIELMKKHGQNGLRLIKNGYNWDDEAIKLTKIVNSMMFKLNANESEYPH